MQTEGFVVYDLAGYLDGTIRYTLLAAQDPATKAAELYVGLKDEETAAAWERVRKSGLMFQSLHTITDEDGVSRYSWVIQKRKGAAYRFYNRVIAENIYHSILQVSGLPLMDVVIQRPIVPGSPAVRYQKIIGRSDERLRIAADDAAALRERADARFLLGNNDQALADYTTLLTRFPGNRDILARRSAVLSRLNRVDEARRDAEELRTRRGPPKEFFDYYFEAFFAPGLGEYNNLVDATPELVLAGKQQGSDWTINYNLACLHSIAARELAHKDPDAAKAALNRAMVHLQTADKLIPISSVSLLSDSDLDALHGYPEFDTLVRQKESKWFFIALWAGNPGRESRGLDSISPAEHIELSRQLIAENFRPISLSVAAKDSSNLLGAASVWHRPATTAGQFAELAARHAYASIAALQLGELDACWDRLRQSPDPSERNLLIHSFAALNVAPENLVARLEKESDSSVRQALLLSLGEYSAQAFPVSDRDSLKPRLLDLYENDTDPGLRSAAEWLLRQWNYEGDLAAAEQDLAKSSATTPGRWALNSQGQTFVAVPGKVSFYMGSPEFEAGKSFDEARHPREIKRSYMIATKPVTFEQFGAFLKAHPELQRAEHNRVLQEKDQPATMVTWFEAAQYCRWLSEVEGVPDEQMCYPPIPEIKPGMLPLPGFLNRTGYRLPTEAEWEYACRAGSTTPFHFGYTSALLDEFAWSFNNSEQHPHPVGRLKPNAWGLFDMHGNVLQWCYDEYSSEYIDQRNGQMNDVNETKAIQQQQGRVLRGGTAVQPAEKLRSASRDSEGPLVRHERVGFRLVRTSPVDSTAAALE